MTLAQVSVLFRRGWRVAKGGVWSTETNLLHLGNGLLCGTLFYRLGFTEDDIYPRFAATFCMTIGVCFFPYMGALGFM